MMVLHTVYAPPPPMTVSYPATAAPHCKLNLSNTSTVGVGILLVIAEVPLAAVGGFIARIAHVGAHADELR